MVEVPKTKSCSTIVTICGSIASAMQINGSAAVASSTSPTLGHLGIPCAPTRRGAADAADPLLDIDTLRQDIEQFKKLGINTIRIYTIDNSQNHDEAMALLDGAGIYLALDANTPKYSLNRENIDSLHASYNDVYLQSVFATIEAFKGYSKS
nr:1,3-beta-glucanosyltransferase gel1 [Quercus suber]